MHYAKTKEISHNEAVTIIQETMKAQGLDCHDLVKKIPYPFEHKGIEELDSFFSGNCHNEKQIREKIGIALGIDHETLHGEHPFESFEEYGRFVFAPYLVRIPEHTSPSQITMFGFAGFERCFVVGRYPELRDKPLGDQLKVINQKINTMGKKSKKQVPFFGKLLGFAFYYDFEKEAIPISMDGNVLDDMKITHVTGACSVSKKSMEITASGIIKIPRLTQNTPERRIYDQQ